MNLKFKFQTQISILISSYRFSSMAVKVMSHTLYVILSQRYSVRDSFAKEFTLRSEKAIQISHQLFPSQILFPHISQWNMQLWKGIFLSSLVSFLVAACMQPLSYITKFCAALSTRHLPISICLFLVAGPSGMNPATIIRLSSSDFLLLPNSCKSTKCF